MSETTTETKPTHNEEETSNSDKMNSYDAVLLTVCDVFGRPRGKFVLGDSISGCVTRGIETPHTTSVLGFHSETPTTLTKYTNESTHTMIPDVATLRPLSWLCADDRKVGHVLCDLYDSKGQLVATSPRAIVLKQLDNLRSLGFEIMTAYEAEFILYHSKTLNPFGGSIKETMNMVRLDSTLNFIYDLTTELLASGIPVETFLEETVSGQIEYSMQPQFGITMADATHRLAYIAKSVCQRNGLEPTFMTRPKNDDKSSGYHLNHSLWTLDGKNAFYDSDQEDGCSDILRHWVAGLILHGKALTALMNPTVNCYERRQNTFTANDNIWNYNDRYARLRVKNKGKNIHIEERTPSSACNPYLSLAALVAAGADGIARKLTAPPPRIFRPDGADPESAKVQDPLPISLEEALLALEQDTILSRAIGEEFVHEFIALCKEFQLEKLKDVMDKEADRRFEVERMLYLHTL